MSWAFEAGAQIFGAINANEVGDAKRDAAYEEARQRDEQAEQEVAVSSFNVQKLKRRAEEIIASNRAKSAAYGQSSTDATSMAIQADTIEKASIDQLMEMAMADERARMMRKDADQMRKSGEIIRDDYRGRAVGQLLGAASTIVDGAGIGSFGGG